MNASRRWIIWVVVGTALLLVWIAVPLIIFLGGAWQRGRPRDDIVLAFLCRDRAQRHSHARSQAGGPRWAAAGDGDD